MTTIQTPVVIRDLWKSVLAWGVLTLLAGIAILVWPGISIFAAAVLFGIYLVLSGIAQIVAAFALDVSGGSRVLFFFSGVLSLVLGVFAFREFSHGSAIWLLAIWIGIGFIFQGVSETALAISFKELPGRGWHVFLGVLSIVAGLVVLGWPIDSILVLAIVTGASLVVIGITQIVWAIVARKEVKSVEHGVDRVTASAGRDVP